MASTFKATLRIRTAVKDPGIIDHALGRVSTGFSPIILLDSQMRRQPCEDSYWKLQLEKKSSEGGLTGILKEFIGLLESGEGPLNKSGSAISSVDIFCMVSSDNGQGTIHIESKVMAQLAKLEIDLIFDIYS